MCVHTCAESKINMASRYSADAGSPELAEPLWIEKIVLWVNMIAFKLCIYLDYILN